MMLSRIAVATLFTIIASAVVHPARAQDVSANYDNCDCSTCPSTSESYDSCAHYASTIAEEWARPWLVHAACSKCHGYPLANPMCEGCPEGERVYPEGWTGET